MSMTRRQLVGITIAATGAAGGLGGLAWLTSRRPAPLALGIPIDTTPIEKGWLRTDPALLRWNEQKPLPVAFQHPTALAVRPDGGLLVAGECAMLALRTDGGEAARYASQGPLRDLALLPDGTVLAAAGNRLDALASDGTWRTWASLPPGAEASGIAASAAGVWVADSAQRRVWRFDLTGRQCGVIGDRCEFVVPSSILDVAAAPDGSVWTTNPGRHRLERFAVDATPLGTWGRAGGAIDAFFGCCNPARIALFPDGRFVTAEKGLPRVKVFRADGTLESVVAGVESFAAGQKGLVPRVDHQGRVLVLDPERRAIRVFTAAGAA